MEEFSDRMRQAGILLFLCTLLMFCQTIYGDDDAKTKKDSAKPAAASTDMEKAVKDLAGTYTIVRGEKEGVKIKGKDLTATKVVIEGNRITTLDKAEGELYVAEFELKQRKNAYHITMNSIKPPMPGVGAMGLLKVGEKNVMLIYAMPDADMPKSFKTTKGQHMFVMKKVDESKDIEEPAEVPVN